MVSSSVSRAGFINQIRNDIGIPHLDIVNNHSELYGSFKDNPLQGPFTQQWVGGFQHRHIILNSGSDVVNNSPELYSVEFPNQHIRIYNKRTSPPAYWTRGELAKRSINIANIHTTSSSTSSIHILMGNYQRNYEVVQCPRQKFKQPSQTSPKCLSFIFRTSGYGSLGKFWAVYNLFYGV